MGKINLLPHNKESYDKIQQSIRNGDKKLAVSHATGTGKSYLIAKLFEDYSTEKKLILVPLLYLKEKMDIFFKNNNIDNVDILLYQSLVKMSDEDIFSMNYKIIALDEYHHGTAEVWGAKVKTLINSHPETIFFGTSATPIRTDGINTIDVLFDGNCVSDLSLPKAIAKGIVPCPKYIATYYTLDERLNELRKKVDKSINTKEEKTELYKQISAMRSQIEKSYGMPIILNNNIKDKEGKFIVFCQDQTHLKEIKETVIGWFKTAGFKKINSYIVCSDYEQKDEEFNAFCNDSSHNLKLLFCVNMLNEGLHLDNISGVLLLRKTNSYIVFLQQIGRVIEASNTNIPIIIDAVNNYTYVKNGIQLLQEIKEAINEEKKSNKYFDDSKFIDIDTFFITAIIQDIESILNSIESKLKTNFDVFIKYLDYYYKKHGNSLVPDHYVETIDGIDFNLGDYVSSLRERKDKLDDEKLSILEKYDFIFDVRGKWFKDNINSIKTICLNEKIHPFEIPPKNPLYQFISQEVKKLNDGLYDNDEHRKEMLEEIKIFKGMNREEYVWEKGFNLWKKYYKQFDRKIPKNFKDEKGFSPYGWIRYQNELYNGYKNRAMPQEHIIRIEKAGYTFKEKRIKKNGMIKVIKLSSNTEYLYKSKDELLQSLERDLALKRTDSVINNINRVLRGERQIYNGMRFIWYEHGMKIDSIEKIRNDTLKSNNKSGVRGVRWDKFKNKWVAELKANGEKHRRNFIDFEDAVKQRKEWEERFLFNR